MPHIDTQAFGVFLELWDRFGERDEERRFFGGCRAEEVHAKRRFAAAGSAAHQIRASGKKATGEDFIQPPDSARKALI